jgi:D-amino-acid dehydrogenase
MSTSADADVLIIGAGVVGAATAYELARRGVQVAVVDTGIDVGNGCSYANAGLLSPGHVEPLTTPANVRLGAMHLWRRDSPFHVRPSPRLIPWMARFTWSSTPGRARRLTAVMQAMAHESVAMHRAYAEAGLQTGFRQDGSLDVFLTERRFDAAVATLGEQRQSHVDVLSGDAARDFEPGLGQCAGALLHHEDAVCETQAFVRETLRAAVDFGARVHWGVEVHALQVTAGRVTGAVTSVGPVAAGGVVVAAGLDSGRLTTPLGLRLPLLGGKGYVVDVAPRSRPRIPLTFKELKVVATPYADRLRLCGTMDLGDESAEIHAHRAEAVVAAARQGLPGLDTSNPLQVWAGQRPCTADGIPVIGPSETVPGLGVAAGHGMWGLVLAPATGAAIARGICGEAVAPGMEAFSPDRFARTGGHLASEVAIRRYA